MEDQVSQKITQSLNDWISSWLNWADSITNVILCYFSYRFVFCRIQNLYKEIIL